LSLAMPEILIHKSAVVCKYSSIKYLRKNFKRGFSIFLCRSTSVK
jgi:hypothetical protein